MIENMDNPINTAVESTLNKSKNPSMQVEGENTNVPTESSSSPQQLLPETQVEVVNGEPINPETTQSTVGNQGEGNAPQQSKMAQPTSQPQPVAAEKPLTRGSIFHSIFETLAGPTQYTYKIDPQTGNMEKTPVQRSTRQLANSVVAGALTGLFAGGQAKGDSGDALGAGGNAVLKANKERDDSAKEEAKSNYARNVSLADNNMRLYQNVLQASRLGLQTVQPMMDENEALYNDLNENVPGSILGTADSSEEAMSKFHVAKDAVFPIAAYPRVDGNGKVAEGMNFKYAAVDPNALVSLTKSLWDKAYKYHIAGTTNGEGKQIGLPDDTKLKATQVLGLMHKVQAFENTQKEIEGLNKNIADSKDVKKPAVAPLNLKNAEIQSVADSAADKYGVDKGLVRAIIKQESQENPKAVSKKGAQGLMQLMPDTAKGLGVTDSFDINQNVDGGVRLIKQLLDKYDGNIEKALAAYNAGESRVDKANGVPDIPETQQYVKNIIGNLQPQTPSASKEEDDADSEQTGNSVLTGKVSPNFLSKALEDGTIKPKDVQLIQKLGIGAFIDKKPDGLSSVDSLLKSGAKGLDTESVGRVKNLLGGEAAINDYAEQQVLKKKIAEENAIGAIKNKFKATAEEDKANAHEKRVIADNEESIKAMGTGKLFNITHISTMRASDRQLLVNEVAKRYPNWNPEEVEAKVDLFKNASGAMRNTQGTFSNSVMNANTSLGHMAGALSAVDKLKQKYPEIMTENNMAEKGINWFNNQFGTDPDWSKYKVSLAAATTDWQNLLNNQHALSKGDKELAEDIVKPTSPLSVAISSIQEMAHTAAVRIKPLNEQWKQTMGKNFPNLIEPDTVQAIKRINNPEVNAILGTMLSGGQLSGTSDGAGKGGIKVNSLITPPKGATMLVNGSDGKKHWSDGKVDLGVAEEQ
jgi:hypothetical protein